MNKDTHSLGFSLIEVSLALMVVGFGLLGIFHLFPAGLRASFDATAETRIGQFADEVLNQLYADAAEDWALLSSGSVDIGLSAEIPLDGTQVLLEYPNDTTKATDLEKEHIRCTCNVTVINPDTDNRLAEVGLRVQYGKSGGWEQAFYTEIYNFGM